MIACTNCNAGNSESAKFCSECGTKLRQTPAAVRPQSLVLSTDGSGSRIDFPNLNESIERARGKLKAMKEGIPQPLTPSLGPLIGSLQTIPPEAQVARIAAIEALGRTRDPAILRSMLLLTGARAKDVRKAVAIALGSTRHSLSAYLLLPMLQDGSSRVRNVALQALIHVGQPYCAEVLAAAAVESKTFRNIIVDTIGILNHSQRLKLAESFDAVRADSGSDAGLCIGQFRQLCFQPMTNKPSMVQPSMVQPSMVQPSMVQPSNSPMPQVTGGSFGSAVSTHSAPQDFRSPSSEMDFRRSSEPTPHPVNSQPVAEVSREQTYYEPSHRSGSFPPEMPQTHYSVEFDSLRMSGQTDAEMDVGQQVLADLVNSNPAAERIANPAPMSASGIHGALGSSDSFADFSFFQSVSTDLANSAEFAVPQIATSGESMSPPAPPRQSNETMPGSGVRTSSSEIDVFRQQGSNGSSAVHFGANESAWNLNASGSFQAIKTADRPVLPVSNAMDPQQQYSQQQYPQQQYPQQQYPQQQYPQQQYPQQQYPQQQYPQQQYPQPQYPQPQYPQQQYPQPPNNLTPNSFPNISVPAFAPQAMHGQSALTDMTGSAPVIPAFSFAPAANPVVTSTAGINSATTGSVIVGTLAAQTINSTVAVPSTAPPVQGSASAQQNEPTPEQEASAHTKALNEKNLRRLAEFRQAAFHDLLQNKESLESNVPRLISKKIASLMTTPATDVERIKQQIRSLGQSKSPFAIEALGTFCHKPAKEVRIACAEALGMISHPSSAVLLLKFLSDKSGTVADCSVRSMIAINQAGIRGVILAAGLVTTSFRTIVTSALDELDPPQKSSWEQFLLTQLSGSDHDLTAFVISLLARMTVATHVEIYLQMVKHDSARIRAACVEALVRTGLKRVIGAINDSMIDPDPQVRSQGAIAVATICSPRSIELLVTLIQDPDLTVRRNAAQTASRIDEAEIGPAVAAAMNSEADATTVEHLLAALNRNGGNDSLSVLTRYVEGESGNLRDLALKALRKLKAPASVPVFRRLLDDSNPAVRRQSVEQLAALKFNAVLPRIHEMLKNDTDESVRGSCAKAIGEMQDKSALPLLEAALEDSAVVRLQAVISLGKLGNHAAGPVLLGLLRDVQPEIRYQAVRAIGQLKLEGSEEQIEALFQDKDEMVRRGAEQALQELGMTVSQIRSRRTKRRFVSILSKLSPNVIAGAIPGGSKSLLVILLLAVSIGAFWGIGSMVSLAGGGEQLPMTSVIGVAASSKTQQAFILRKLDILDVWSLTDTTLTNRFKVPAGTTQIIPEANGSLLLVHPDEGIRQLDLKVSFSPEGAKLVAFEGTVAGIFMETQSNSLCLFENAAAGPQLRILDAATLQEKNKISLPVPFKGNCIVSPDMKYAAMLQTNGALTLVDTVSRDVAEANVANMAKIASLDMVFAIQFSSDMKYFCFGGTKGFFSIQIDKMSLVKHVKDAGGCVFIQALPGSSDVLALTGGSVLEFKDEFQTMSTVAVPTLSTFNYMDPQGKMIISAADDQKEVQVFNVQAKTSVNIPPNE